MKTIYKTLVLGVFLIAGAAVSPAFAQDKCTDLEGSNAVYQKYLDNYKGVIDKSTVDKRKIAVAAAKEYVETYGSCTNFKDYTDYLTKKGPELEQKIAEAILAWERDERYARFDKAALARNTAEIFASGEDILKYEPDFVDVILVLAGAGLDETAEKKVDTYNGKTIDYAKSAIKKLQAGTESQSKKYGFRFWEFDDKENAIGWMTYTIGWIEYFRQGNKTAGLNNLYNATQIKSEIKEKDFIYALVGDNYVDKSNALNKEILELIKAKEGQESFASKSKLSMSKGYVDRAIDAYSRAYDAAKAALKKETKPELKAKKQTYIDELYETLKGLYKFRYETVEAPIAEPDLVNKLNSHIASVTKSSFLSPTAEVVPVDPPNPDEEKAEKEAATTTTGTTTTTPVKPKAIPTPAPPTSKAATNSSTVKSDADKTNNKPKKQ